MMAAILRMKRVAADIKEQCRISRSPARPNAENYTKIQRSKTAADGCLPRPSHLTPSKSNPGAFPEGRGIVHRAVTGHSILNEIRAVRLNRAKELLAADNLKASEIAARCGYRSWSSVFRLIARKSSPITARRAGR